MEPARKARICGSHVLWLATLTMGQRPFKSQVRVKHRAVSVLAAVNCALLETSRREGALTGWQSVKLDQLERRKWLKVSLLSGILG